MGSLVERGNEKRKKRHGSGTRGERLADESPLEPLAPGRAGSRPQSGGELQQGLGHLGPRHHGTALLNKREKKKKGMRIKRRIKNEK